MTRMPMLPLAAIALAACATAPSEPAKPTDATTESVPSKPFPSTTSMSNATPSAPMPNADNPLFADSTLPYRLPPFDRIRNEHFRPAFEQGMAELARDVAAIAHNSAPADFDNTIVALERAGRLLDRTSNVFFNLNASNTHPDIEQIQAEMAPKLAASRDAVYLDAALYARVEALYGKRESLGLDEEQLQLLTRYRTEFVRAGARLGEADKTRLRDMNAQLSTLTTQFAQNVLKATKAGAVVVDDVAQLEGLSEPQISAAAGAAKARGLEGKWVLTLQNTTIQPVLAQMKNRALRERVYKASIGRAVGGEFDNTAVVAQIVKLRAERARLLGYATHADYVLEDETAGTPAAVNAMLRQLAPAAVANARREAEEIQKQIDAEAKAAHRPGFKLQPWDWAYYAEQVRKARFAYDDAAIKPYFEMNRVMQDGVFYAAHKLYGLDFKERHDLPVYEPSVRVFEVYDRDGSTLGLFLADYYARDNKRGGAWMNSFVEQSKLFGLKPVVVNNLNVAKPADGQPTLLTFDEVTTMFHEFGHALHGLLSDVHYPTLAGTSVPRDFVEYPSQYNEMWGREPEVLAHYARHWQTGEPLPRELLDKVLAAQKYGEGFATTEYLAAAMLDQNWHQIDVAKAPTAKGVMAFEAAALHADGVDFAPVGPRYHTSYFSHIFAGGYSAGYYAYLWSEVLARDTEHWMKVHGGLKRENGDYLRAKVLSRGRTRDPSLLFREFYGAPPEIEPLLEHRGLSMPKAK